ncbi:hypothetical protein DFS34DRAFT_595030 [Phlyctochytrium arcticum]|nr:hypothetical protein DFS34DRAFT_595030 [Phlyctochytrium arcticum]
MSEQQKPTENEIQTEDSVDSSIDQVETNESDPIDKVVNSVKTKKKERTPKQQENMKKAQAKRTENLREMKKLKEQHDKEVENAKLLKQQERDEEIARKAIEKYVALSKPKRTAKKVNVSNIPNKKQSLPKRSPTPTPTPVTKHMVFDEGYDEYYEPQDTVLTHIFGRR